MKRIPLPRVEAANEPVFDYAQVLTHILLTAPAGRPLPTAAMMARWEVAQKVRRHAGASVLLEAAEYAQVKAALDAFQWTMFTDSCAGFVHAIAAAAEVDPNAAAAAAAEQQQGDAP